MNRGNAKVRHAIFIGRSDEAAPRFPFLGKEFYEMFRWFNQGGYKADIAGLCRRYPEIHLHSLEEWLREDGWEKRALRFRAPKE